MVKNLSQHFTHTFRNTSNRAYRKKSFYNICHGYVSMGIFSSFSNQPSKGLIFLRINSFLLYHKNSSFPRERKMRKTPSGYLARRYSRGVDACDARSFISCFNFRSTCVTVDQPRKLLHVPCGRKKREKKIRSGHRKASIGRFAAGAFRPELSQTFI